MSKPAFDKPSFARMGKNGKPRYELAHLNRIKPLKWEGDPKDGSLHRKTGEVYSEWQKRMDCWALCHAEATEPE